MDAIFKCSEFLPLKVRGDLIRRRNQLKKGNHKSTRGNYKLKLKTMQNIDCYLIFKWRKNRFTRDFCSSLSAVLYVASNAEALWARHAVKEPLRERLFLMCNKSWAAYFEVLLINFCVRKNKRCDFFVWRRDSVCIWYKRNIFRFNKDFVPLITAFNRKIKCFMFKSD